MLSFFLIVGFEFKKGKSWFEKNWTVAIVTLGNDYILAAQIYFIFFVKVISTLYKYSKLS